MYISISPINANPQAGSVLVSKSYGVLYACADDLGSALLRIASLKSMHAVFKIMASVAGLFLNPRKCVIVPLVPTNSG